MLHRLVCSSDNGKVSADAYDIKTECLKQTEMAVDSYIQLNEAMQDAELAGVKTSWAARNAHMAGHICKRHSAQRYGADWSACSICHGEAS